MTVSWLPPTVVAPLVAGSRHVRVEGLAPTPYSTLDVEVDGQVSSFDVETESVTIELDSDLVAGQLVKARLWFTAMTSTKDSPEVEVLPFPGPNPVRVRLPAQLRTDQPAVPVWGAPPGHEVRVTQSGVGDLGSAVAGPRGIALVEVTGALQMIAGNPVLAELTTPWLVQASFEVVPSDLPVPKVRVDPTFAGQTLVVVRGAIPGSHVELDIAVPDLDLPAVLIPEAVLAGPDGVASFRLLSPAAPELVVEAHSSLPPGEPSDPVAVQPGFSSPPPGVPGPGGTDPYRVNDLLPPRIRGPVNELEQLVWLDRWVPGVLVEIWRFDLPFDTPPTRLVVEPGVPDIHELDPHTVLGTRSVGAAGRIALDEPLGRATDVPFAADGRPNVVWVAAVQRVEGVLLMSQPERVEALSRWEDSGLPLDAPVLLEPVLDCAQAVTVGRVMPGAEVVVYQDGAFVGWARADLGGTVRVEVLTLAPGAVLAARQAVGGIPSAWSGQVFVGPGTDVRPTVLGPVCLGDRRLWASGVTPGSVVAAFDDDGWLGSSAAAEPVVRIPLWRPIVGSSVFVSARRCDNELTSAAVAVQPQLLATTPEQFSQDELDLRGQWPGIDVDPPSEVEELVGELYLPADPPTGPGATLVIVMHGVNSTERNQERVETDLLAEGTFGLEAEAAQSYRGYDVLCQSLAAHGIVVVSLAARHFLSDAQRADLMQHAVETFVSDGRALGLTEDVFVGGRVGVVGHSAGGGGALILAARRGAQFGVLGENPVAAVVAFAPTTFNLTEVDVPALLLFGSDDHFVLGDPFLAPWSWRDFAAGEWTFGWALGADHLTWNAVWSGRIGPAPLYRGTRTGGEDLENERALAAMSVAFLLRHLEGLDGLAPFLSGPVRPAEVEAVPLRFDHRPGPGAGGSRVVIDHFDSGSGGTNELGGPNEVVPPTTPYLLGGLASGSPPLGSFVYVDSGATLALQATAGDLFRIRWPPGAVGLAQPTRLSFRAALLPGPNNAWPSGGDLLVTVSDGVEVATVRAGLGGQRLLPIAERPFASRIDLLGPVWAQSSEQPLVVPQFVSIDLQSFAAVNPALSVGAISGLSLSIDGLFESLDYAIDDLALAEDA